MDIVERIMREEEARTCFSEGEYKIAIGIWTNLDKNFPKNIYKSWLYQCYHNIGDYKKALYYIKLMGDKKFIDYYTKKFGN